MGPSARKHSNLSEMSDEELLRFTKQMEADAGSRMVECVDCGSLFEAANRTWNAKRCPECQKSYTYSQNIHHDRRRTGDGLKNGLFRRVR